jgi:hypothetical protein
MRIITPQFISKNYLLSLYSADASDCESIKALRKIGFVSNKL